MNEQRWRAGHLPGLDAGQVDWHVLPFEAHGRRVAIEVPLLDEAALTALSRRVRQAARDRLQPLYVDQIIDIVARAVARLLDPQDPARRELDELLPIVTGCDAEMVRLGLTSYLHTFRAPQLRRFLAQDFPNPKVLDGFQPATKGGSVRAFGPALLAHLWAGNVPGLPLWSLVCGLLVKAGNVGKLPSAEPVFASVAARVLAEVHPPLADCLAMVWWKGGQAGPAKALYGEADTVLAYGGNAALRAVRDELPVTTRFLAYGHKIGLAMVGRAALDRQRGPATARLAALDMVRYEQQGCYSPHVLYVERGGAVQPREFAQYLAAELANLSHRHPPRALSLEEAAALADWRQAAEWQALGAPGGELLGGEGSGWSVVFRDTPQPLAPTAGHRSLAVSAVDSLDEVVAQLEPHGAFLQTAGLATTSEELFRLGHLLGQAGVTRIAPIGGMAQPEAGWHHDGRFNLADLVRMVEIEQSAEAAADRLEPSWQEGRP
ncbi:acyl-CoA reductase [Ramlibacter henchirensis]|uniref:Acyl-CoA reductase n=1 Tax=Ramlibacter henchirensis TaxID=204072 RepID=A0A4Z0BLD5_9BURK|nr:acyl-CoA reductase [Ramlibacter henchirensis]TFY99233.1 acyl-CoA reductase [Ramlibacter henchirensis]